MGKTISIEGNSSYLVTKIWREEYAPFSRGAKKRFRAISVDVWRSRFGAHSVAAIFDVYSQYFNIPSQTMKKNQKRYTFSFCLNALRKVENPEYESPRDSE